MRSKIVFYILRPLELYQNHESMKICFATQNQHKAREVAALLGDSFKLVNLEDLGHTKPLEETHDTLEENALEKAQFVFEKYQIPCFADDSGLEVEALDMAPGVHTAYYAGPQRSAEANNNLLLKNLEGKTNRNAQFRTVIAFVAPNVEQLFEGVIQGMITEKPEGNNNFGYDPVFIPGGYDQTYANMSLEEKNKVSSRATAFQKFIAFLKNNY